MDIALDHLTEAEQDAIYAVLRRDDQLRTKDHERIRQLQNEVKRIKLAGVIKPGMDADKTCARCRKEFGWIFNKGQICPNCQHKVCENCRANLKTGGWLCILCKTQREIEAMSGQWFYKKFRKSKRNRKTNQVISGNEIIRASIRKKPGGPRHGRMRNSGEFEARNSGKRTVSPSSLLLGSDGGGEDSDTQSTEMGPTVRSRRQDLAFPKDSDQARLQNLITGGTVTANPPPSTRRVITVGTRHDSSSSESEPNSPSLTKSKNSFTQDESIHSSGRASPVSAISSEGHMTMVTERDISDIESLRSAVSGMEDIDSRRTLDNAQTTAAPPRRLAKTLEQERLEALQEKSQEDLAGYSDSDGLVPPSRVKHVPGVGGAKPVDASNPYDIRLRATNTHTDNHYLTMAFSDSLHAASASSSLEQPSPGVTTTTSSNRTLTDATNHANAIKNSPSPELLQHKQHPHSFKSTAASNQQSYDPVKSSAKRQAFLEAPHIDVMYKHYTLDLSETLSSTSSESDIESQDGHSLTSRDADVESLDSHKEFLESHTAREFSEFLTPLGSLEYLTPQGSVDMTSDPDSVDSKSQLDPNILHVQQAKNERGKVSSPLPLPSFKLVERLEATRKTLQEPMSSSSSSTELSDDGTPPAPGWHPAWELAVASDPENPDQKISEDTASSSHQRHNDPPKLIVSQHKDRAPIVVSKVFDPFNVIVDDDVKYTSAQLPKEAIQTVSPRSARAGSNEFGKTDSFDNGSKNTSPSSTSPKSPRSEFHEASFLDDDEDDYIFDDDIIPSSRSDNHYTPRYWQAIAHREEDDTISDTLSVITELTEPVDSDKSWSDDDFSKSLDNTVMEIVDLKVLKSHSLREQGLPNTDKAWLRSYRSMSLTSTLAYNECIAVSGESEASLTDMVRANQDENDLEFSAVYEFNSSMSQPTKYTKVVGTYTSPIGPSSVDSSDKESFSSASISRDGSLQDSPTSVKDAVKSWETKKKPQQDKSYYGNDIDWSEVYEIDMVEEEESDVTASDSGFPASASLEVPSADERVMKRAGDEVVSDDSGAKVFKSYDSSLGADLVAGQLSDGYDKSGHDSQSSATGEITPTNSISSSDSHLTPSQSDTAAAQQEALQELRANISVALKRLSDDPHEEEFRFDEKSSITSSDDRANQDIIMQEVSTVTVTKEYLAKDAKQDSLDILADEYEHAPVAASVKLREQMMRNANRNTLDYLAEENLLEEEKEIDLDDIIQENTNDVSVLSENVYANVGTWTSTPRAHAHASESESDSETDREDFEQSLNMSVVEAREVAVSVPITKNAFEWEKLDSDPTSVRNQVQVQSVDVSDNQDFYISDGDGSREVTSKVTTVTVTKEVVSEVIKRQPSDSSDSVKSARHRKMYVVDTDTKVFVPGVSTEDDSDSLNDQSSSNRSSTIASVDSDPQVEVRVENIDANLTHATDTAVVPKEDPSNTPPAINSDAKKKPNFLKRVQNRLGFGSDDDDLQKKSVSFNPYNEEFSDHGSEKSPDTSFVAEPVSEVAVAAVVTHSFVEKVDDSESNKGNAYEITERQVSFESSENDKSSGPAQKDIEQDARVGVISTAAILQTLPVNESDSDFEASNVPQRKDSTGSRSSLSSQSSKSSHHSKDGEESRIKSGSEISSKSDSQSSGEEIINPDPHQSADNVSRTDSETGNEYEYISEDRIAQKRVLVRQEMYVESDSDANNMSKTDSRESEFETTTDATNSFDIDYDSDYNESVSAGVDTKVVEDSVSSSSKNTDDEPHVQSELQNDSPIEPQVEPQIQSHSQIELEKELEIDSRTSSEIDSPIEPQIEAQIQSKATEIESGNESQDESQDESLNDQPADSGKMDDEVNELAGSMAAAMVADVMRDAGWDESGDGVARDAVPDSPESPVVSVRDGDLSANPNHKRGDSTLSEGSLSMSSSELTNPAPPTTSPPDSMAQEDRVDTASTNEANGGVVPVIMGPKDASLGRKSKTSAMSDGSSLVEPQFDEDDEEDDIDELFSTAAKNRSVTNLSSTYSESRESIASYYSDAGEGSKYPVTGEIEFGGHYNYKTGIFEVHVKKCRDIAAVDAKRKRTDPYVKVYLLPDKSRAGKRKTKVKKHTLCPVFDEILRFSITKSELESRTLSLSVWHNDRFGKNDFLGEVALPLDGIPLDSLKPDWYPLLDKVSPLSPSSIVSYKGDLLVSLKFEQDDRDMPGSLHVNVKEARNLTPKDNGVSDPFCKAYLLPDKTSKQSKQKTAVKKKTVNPKWDQTLSFTGMTLSDLSQRSLELTVWDHDRFNRNDFLGGVRLNLGKGKSEGCDVDWMDGKGEEISLWQSMLHRPNVWIDSNLMLRPNMDKRH